MAIDHDQSKKSPEYYGNVRHEIISLVPENSKFILDVGCGNGATSTRLKELNADRKIFGVEFFPEAAALAKKRLDHVLVGDVEAVSLDFPEEYFDCIICADILEHCRDPWAVLKKLRPLLKSDGILIVSIPNIRHITVILKIVFDRWQYEKSGILDETHLRFFTFHTIKKMLQDTGFEILQTQTNKSTSGKFRILNLLSLGILRPFSIYQYILTAKKLQ